MSLRANIGVTATPPPAVESCGGTTNLGYLPLHDVPGIVEVAIDNHVEHGGKACFELFERGGRHCFRSANSERFEGARSIFGVNCGDHTDTQGAGHEQLPGLGPL